MKKSTCGPHEHCAAFFYFFLIKAGQSWSNKPAVILPICSNQHFGNKMPNIPSYIIRGVYPIRRCCLLLWLIIIGPKPLARPVQVFAVYYACARSDSLTNCEFPTCASPTWPDASRRHLAHNWIQIEFLSQSEEWCWSALNMSAIPPFIGRAAMWFN